MWRAAWWNASLGYEVTGANLAWMMQTQLTRGVLPTAVNASALSQGFARLWQEVKVVNDTNDGLNQGIQVDASYHMHSAQLQVASYGQDYLSEVMLFATVAGGTAYALPAPLTDILCDYVAGGMAWLTNGRALDWTAGGRQVARPGASAQMLVNVNMTRVAALARTCSQPAAAAAVSAYIARVAGDAAAPRLLGNKHMFTSDHMTHRRAGWSVGLHMRSLRTRPPECGNGENLRGEHMGNGVLNLVGDGFDDDVPDSGGVAEYANIFPLLAWSQINGVIADTALPVPDCADVAGCCWASEVMHNLTAWVGGVSDGAYGAAVMDTRTHSVSARRAWFFFDGAVVALTADAADGGAATAAVRTTLASRLLWGNISAGFANGTVDSHLPWRNDTLPLGGADGVTWVQAVGHAWLPTLPAAGPPPQALLVSAGRRYGTWQSIGASTGVVSNDTLTLALAHERPLSGARFGYALLPAVNASAAAAAAAAALRLAIVNEGAAGGGVQAVADADARVGMAVFWPAGGGAVVLGAGGAWPLAINVSAPCLVSYREVGAIAILAVAAPVPTAGAPTTTVTVDRALVASADCPAVPAPGGATAIAVLLPLLGDYQGDSVVFRCALAS